MACLRRGKNLCEELVRARLPPVKGSMSTRTSTGTSTVGFRACKAGRKNCSLCPYTGDAFNNKTVISEIKIYHNNSTVRIGQNITCRDQFCLYILSCNKPGCRKQYVGMTTRQCYIRFSEHLTSIRNPDSTCPVGLHWKEPGHRIEHLTFIPVEKLGNRCRITLRQREKDLINRTGLLEARLNQYI